jgi:hypothetical protein
MNAFVKDLRQPSKRATATVATRKVSTPKPQDDGQREAWRQALGQKLVEAGNRMETDPEYRKKIQSMTR